MTEVISCTLKQLPTERLVEAANAAVAENPMNQPQLRYLGTLRPAYTLTREEIAVVTSKYWRTNGVRLTVGFLDNPPRDLRARILSHMNAWNRTANVLFVETSTDPQVRIARGPTGYWSYLGTDILLIKDKTQPTMNLQDFTMNTPDSEFYRVVRHETGHTLGCPHEHMREELVALIDPDKAIQYFGATQGWSPDQVRAQVLTPLDQASIMGTPNSDQTSIMCYQIPGAVTRNGQPILGGTDIDATDYSFMASVYPMAVKALQEFGLEASAAAEVAAPLAAPGHSQAHHRLENGELAIKLPNGSQVRLQQNFDFNQLVSLLQALSH
jgi:hypothetical protein